MIGNQVIGDQLQTRLQNTDHRFTDYIISFEMQPVLEIFPVPKRYPYEKITFTIPMHNACLQLYGSSTKIKNNGACFGKS